MKVINRIIESMLNNRIKEGKVIALFGARRTGKTFLTPLELRNDQGILWENYIIAERLKSQHYSSMLVNNFFWRTYDQQEIDWVEERDGQLFAYEFKWNKKQVKVPAAWKNAYPDAHFEIIHPENYLDFLRIS
jgi:uncharacterized protein